MCSQLPAQQGRQVALPAPAVFGYFETGSWSSASASAVLG